LYFAAAATTQQKQQQQNRNNSSSRTTAITVAARKADSEAHLVAAATPTNDLIYFNYKKSIYRDNPWI